MGKYTGGRLISHGHSPMLEKASSRHNSRSWTQSAHMPLVMLVMIALWAAAGFGYIAWSVSRGTKAQLPDYMSEPVLISYSYFEKDAIQVSDPGQFGEYAQRVSKCFNTLWQHSPAGDLAAVAVLVATCGLDHQQMQLLLPHQCSHL